MERLILTSLPAEGDTVLTTFTDARGTTTTWTYDGRNRLISKTDPLIQTEHYSYDTGGNLLQKTDRLGQTSGYSYDALDRIRHLFVRAPQNPKRNHGGPD